MSRLNGFLQLRRGIFQHVRDGLLNPLQALCFIYMLTQADTRTGVWNGGAGALAGELSISRRTARHVLEQLDGRYIKRFPTPGRHECYPILLHKFALTGGQHVGKQLNALESPSPEDLRHVHGQHLGPHHGEHIATQRKLETGNRRKEQNLAAKPTPLADPRFCACYDSAYEAYRAKHGQPPTWAGKDRKQLKALLASNLHVTVQEFLRRFNNYLQSTEQFTRSHGDSLAYFVAAFDRFLDGPVLERGFTGGSNAERAKSNSAAIHAQPGKYDDVHIQRLSN